MIQELSIEEQAFNAEKMLFGDDRLGVMFYMQVVEDSARTLAEGRKCFREEEYVRIMVPGDRTNVVERPVQVTGILPTDDRMRFAKQYERFKTKQAQTPHEGTPLTLWPQIPPTLAEELKFINIFTVEQLADLADTYVHKLPMGHQWKQKAAQFVQAMKDQSQVNKLQMALDERDTRIDALENAIKEQAEQIAAMQKRSK